MITGVQFPEGFRLHDLRQAGDDVARRGCEPGACKEALAHASLATRLAYTHLQREHLAALVTPDGKADPAKSAQILAPRRMSGSARGVTGRAYVIAA